MPTATKTSAKTLREEKEITEALVKEWKRLATMDIKRPKSPSRLPKGSKKTA